MTVNSKPDFASKTTREQTMLRQSLNTAKAQANQTDGTLPAQADQEAAVATAPRSLNDTIDLSVNPETGKQSPEEVKETIDSISMAEETLKSLNSSILENPEEAMLAQANSVPQTALELIS